MGANSTRVIVVLGLICGLTPFAIDMYLPAITSIAETIDTNTEQVQLTISAYLLTFSLGQLLFGPISDSVGRRPVAVFGLILFFIASIAIALSGTLSQLMLLRMIQGVGGAAVTVAIMATLRDLYSGNALAKMTSYLMIVMAIAPMIAPFIGAQLLYFFNWHSIFYCLALLAVIALVLYLPTLTESLDSNHRQPFKVGPVIAAYGKVLSDKPTWHYLLINAFSSAPLFIFISASPQVYIEQMGVSPQHYAYYFAFNVTLLMFHSWLNTRLLRYWGFDRILPISVAVSLVPVSALLVVSLTLPAQHLLLGMVPLIALTIGITSLISANAYAGLMTRHPKNAGSAAAIAAMARFGFGALAGALVNIFSTGDHLGMVGGMFLAALLGALVMWLKASQQQEPEAI